MHFFKRDIGSLGEDIAENFLKQSGYAILDRNFRCKMGEIDVIGKDDKCIAFIEVKTRYGDLYGTPAEAITYSKQYKIYKTAQLYILKKKLYNFNFRFDVVEVILSIKDNFHSVKLIKDAFEIQSRF